MNDARMNLVVAFRAVATSEQAWAIVDALDAYPEEPDRAPAVPFENMQPNYAFEMEKIQKERDAAVEALKTVQETLKKLTGAK